MDFYPLIKLILIVLSILALIFGFAICNDERSGYNE